ncbi:MAG: toprim domain-containing protein [Massiliimalia sp.]|jgi:ribonuclease M5
MIHVKQAVVVEGKYDKIKLQSFLDGVIIQTDGFRIFKDPDKCAMLRTLADTVGLIVLTDSDAAGFKIRGFIRSVTKNSPNVVHIYIPQVPGKERRKTTAGKEGLLGVEGLDAQLLEQLLKQHQLYVTQKDQPAIPIQKWDLYEAGLSGGEHSGEKRRMFLKYLSLPDYLSANAMLPVLNAMMDLPEFEKTVSGFYETLEQTDTDSR